MYAPFQFSHDTVLCIRERHDDRCKTPEPPPYFKSNIKFTRYTATLRETAENHYHNVRLILTGNHTLYLNLLRNWENTKRKILTFTAKL